MKKLYETDFNIWIDEQAECLKLKKFQNLDLENLIEEIESMSRSDKRALKSQMVRILKHLLKLKYQHQKQETSSSWRESISDAQHQIEAIIEDSPSLESLTRLYLQEGYAKAICEAARETGLPDIIFTKDCPWTIQEVLEE